MADVELIKDETPEIDLENLEEDDSQSFELYPDTNTPENTGKNQAGAGVPRNPDGTIKKGFSLNPKGKPKGAISASSVLRKIVLELDTDTQPTYNPDGTLKKRSSLEMILRKLTAMAKAGDITAIKELIDRIDGKARQSVQIDNNTKVRFNPADYAEMEKLWFVDNDDVFEDDEEEQPEQKKPAQQPTETVEVDANSAQAMADAKPAVVSKEPEYDSEQDEQDTQAHAV